MQVDPGHAIPKLPSMHPRPLTRVLILDANADHAMWTRDQLSAEDQGYVVECVHELETALSRVAAGESDVVVLEPLLPDSQGLEALVKLRVEAEHIPIVVVTELADEQVAAQALRGGAQDYFLKRHLDGGALARALRHALERKYVGEALRESEERFRRVFEEGPVGMALVSSDSELVRVNTAFRRMLGYEEGELTGVAFSTLTHPDDVDGEVALAERIMRGEIPHNQLEKRLLRKDGTAVWTLLTASTVRGDDGEPLYSITTAEDITERKRAEEAVRESQALLQAVIGGTTDAIYVKDSNGRYLLLNAAAAQLLGKSTPEVVGHDDASLFPRHVARQIRESDQKVINSGIAQTFEEKIETPDGLRTFLSTKGAYRDEKDEVVGIFGIMRDITARKLAEEELRRSEETYRALVNHAIHGIYRSSLDGKFLAVNPALVKMLRYQSEEELLRINMERDLYTDPTERARLVEQFRREAVIRGIDVHWKCCDGGRITVRLSGRPVYGEDGELDGFEMIAEDVSDRRALETQLRQAQKMEAVGELTGGIAHDLNNVLTIMSANLDLVTDAIPEELASLRADLEETQAAARRGRALIKKLLGFSRRSKLEVRPTGLGQLVTDVSAMLRRVVPENIRVLISVEPGHDIIDADAGAMEQILINLVTNARDAMPDGGDITINVYRSRLEDGYLASHPWARLRDCVALAVSDTGTGMDESTRERVFEPFFTTKPHGVGTGLGLAMVYGLVKQHGGVIDVESEVGNGTTIRIYFPVSTAKTAPQTREETPSEVRGGTETVLVVEDEEPIRRVARRVLEKHGYRVVLAVDGEDALRKYRDQRNRIKLIISDIVMPNVGGMKFYEILRKEGPPPKILFTSGYTARDVRNSGMFDSSLPFLHKPWSVTELLQKVREVLDSDVASGN